MPALRCELQDGIAVLTLDLTDHPVNVISRAVKDEFNATFERLAAEPGAQAVALFSGKPDNFIAGADIEEVVKLSSAAGAQRLSAHGPAMPSPGAAVPKPVGLGDYG